MARAISGIIPNDWTIPQITAPLLYHKKDLDTNFENAAKLSPDVETMSE